MTIKISLISLHGLIRSQDVEYGRDADTGGQIKYVLELAAELARRSDVHEVELLTRQIFDPKVDKQYSVPEEQISDKARIVRIPFGPKRYLRKEALWPYIEMFVDQTLAHFKRTSVPDLLHGHYADAGMAGAQLARLLHLPYVFTGHSLGRVKQQRLSIGHKNPESLERKYQFTQRIEAEEIALETASMVVTSTHQEVQDQYALYDHYVPSRMNVIPPGVDLTRFTPTNPTESEPDIAKSIARFLVDQNKPMILTLARPDERKNLESLVRVYGESSQLQKLANLVLILGTREDLDSLPKAQRHVIERILALIDKYDLYGKVAYPKTHASQDIPDLYRLAAQRKGVFVNPALTEPFGLTLLEAGATGLPIVATHDGGPNDIIGNCGNGLLIDPLNDGDIRDKLIASLSDPEQWMRWSDAGIKGTRQHYSWEHHATRYLNVVGEFVKQGSATEGVNRPVRRLPQFDRLIVTDLDNTLTGDDHSLREFVELVNSHKNIGFGIATGRRLDSAMQLIEDLHLPRPDLIATDAGTQLHYGDNLTEDRSWRKSIGYAWKPDEIRNALNDVPGVFMQPESNQSQFKISYQIDPEICPKVTVIRKILREAGVRATVMLSLGVYLDILPVRGGGDSAIRHALWKWGFAPENVLVAGDCGNDAGMLLGQTLGVVVANYSPELERLRRSPRVYFSDRAHAAGIIDGIHYYNFLGDVTIPNDRVEDFHSQESEEQSTKIAV
ncbi:HAD-IIB family hydrolase [Stieleria varia]|uniref:sucrose-phosphate synthase n=1 Tax=Stieleria varia TaxID=2528005 RepID=A0A5C6A680_9BACT|nr:HAD-IIB family hydrolase [Stieleria varia]TWT93853.1 Mannosylfructose-phosphate synthase [Stieleria varia]